MNNIGPRIASAALAQGTASLVGKITTIGATVALARLLYPEDFGLQAVALIAVGFASVFSNFGFQAYVIQAVNLSPTQLNTCYTLNILFSAVLGLLVAGAGFVVPGESTDLKRMLLLYGAVTAVSGLSYTELALLKRQLHFRLSARAELAYSVVSNTSRVLFAAFGVGALCFPMGDVLGALARWFVSRRCIRADLHLTLPRSAESGHVLRFGAYTASVGLASFIANQIDKALLTISQTTTSLGVYGFATTMSGMFYNALIVPQSSVFLAAFSRLQHTVEGARDLLTNSSRAIFSLALPLNVLWLIEAERLVTLLFGERWMPAAPIIRILAIDYLVRSMFSGFAGIQLSFGRAREAALTKWTNSALFATFMLVAWYAHMDLEGYAAMFVAASVLSTAHNVHANGRVVDFRMAPFLRSLAVPGAIAIASTGVWWLAVAGSRSLPLTFSTILAVSAWLASYLLLSLCFNSVVVKQILSTIRPKPTSNPHQGGN